jgi:hypothetical protein
LKCSSFETPSELKITKLDFDFLKAIRLPVIPQFGWIKLSLTLRIPVIVTGLVLVSLGFQPKNKPDSTSSRFVERGRIFSSVDQKNLVAQ